MTVLKILLLDMDDVLIRSFGYQQALMDTVAIIGRTLGFADVAITSRDIEVFEAARATSEWDSSAICYALLLMEIWKKDPEVSLPTDPPLPQITAHSLPAPDFQVFFREHLLPDHSEHVLKVAKKKLLAHDNLTSMQRNIIESILLNARQLEGSLTHRIFQELTLGSDEFSDLYGLPAHWENEGYLASRDKPNLNSVQIAAFRDWLERQNHAAAVITNRPTLAPDGSFGTPEAEIGIELLDLQGLPLIGHGGISWLQAQGWDGADPFMKPSPVHALAALRVATGASPVEALLSAAALALDQENDASWKKFDQAEMIVFEDSVKGLLSARTAAGILTSIGVRIKVSLFGITTSDVKRASLEQIADRIFPDIASALESAGVL